MANYYYSTAGLEPDDYPTSGTNEYYITAGLPPVTIIASIALMLDYYEYGWEK
jgi:hypothetical protein